MRILLVEDDEMIGEAVSVALNDAMHAVDWVCDGDAADLALKHEMYQAVLLDIGLPNRDGFEILRCLRLRDHRLPVVVMTARDAVGDRVRGLDMGADDYVIKPFDMSELLARVRAVVRRETACALPILGNGIVFLNPATREATHGDRRAALTLREVELLQALLKRAGTILTRNELEGQLYGWNREVDSNMVDFLIHSIRRKLGADSIRNIRGAGWMVEKRK